ncbi:uncharacterized protein LOC110177835 [Drosophila serrata]|uniref:uncharacterized protein LOC110177835 n=1 Tax=Drosophila serrata TaxID=7274 RepID=UPI000A1D2EC9|nr:uncharacterized protein LOC110177835 [Drosophila serrata]
MNGARKLKSLRTVRLGDVLYDDQKRLMMLCRSCDRHFVTFEAFQKHLNDCSGLKHIVTPSELLSYDEAKRETRLVGGRQELHIYDIEGVKLSSTFDLEAELEDPRWYTDPKPSLSPVRIKSDLAKENVVEIKLQLPQDEPEEDVPPPKRPRTLSNPRRPILTAQQQRKTRSTNGHPTVTQGPMVKTKKKEPILVPTVMEELKRLQVVPKKKSPTGAASSGASQSPSSRTSRLATKHTPLSPPKTSPVASQMTSESKLPMVSIPMDGTQKILNKLRACGVEVKRGNTILTPPGEASSTKNQEALDIMRKLQSKGIRCTKVTKQ